MRPEPNRLRALELFAELSPEDLETVSRWSDVRTAGAGERLTPQGAAGSSFFVIESGTADVVQDGRSIATLGPGDLFGEVAVVTGARWMADVVAATDLTAIEIAASGYRDIEASMPELAERIRAATQQRLA